MRVALLAIVCCFALVAAALAPMPAAAQGGSGIAAFYGKYKGEGIAKQRDSADFSRATRQLDTTIEAAPDGGFTVKWTTVEGSRSSENALAFVPSGKANVFRGSDSADPIAKGYYAWARLDGNTLTVNVFEVGDEGAGRWQVYERRLTGDGMELVFRRLDPTGALRIVTGKLKKQ